MRSYTRPVIACVLVLSVLVLFMVQAAYPHLGITRAFRQKWESETIRSMSGSAFTGQVLVRPRTKRLLQMPAPDRFDLWLILSPVSSLAVNESKTQMGVGHDIFVPPKA